MEIRTLRYFLAVAREKNITRAANSLHVTQPTLSKQIKELEESLNKQLLIRGNRQITLTEEGQLLKKRAEEIIDLVDRTEWELSQCMEEVTGNVYIGGGESHAMRLITKAIHQLKNQYPKIQFHLHSATAQEVMDKIDHGSLDFGVVIGSVDKQNYDFRQLPTTDRWGLLVTKDNPLANHDTITADQLTQLPLICSRQALNDNELSGWLGADFTSLNIVATYNLLYNATLMVEEGMGSALCLDKLANTSEDSPLTFIPLDPLIESPINLIWKRHVPFTAAAQLFHTAIQDALNPSQSTE